MKKEILNKPNDKSYSRFFDVIKVKVYPKKKAWDIHIKQKKLLSINEKEETEKYFKELYGLKEVELIIESIAKEAFIKSRDEILNLIYKENPSFKGFINGSVLEYKNDCAIITLTSKSALEYLKEKNFNIIFNNIMDKFYNMNIKIKMKHNEEEENCEYINNLLDEEKQIVKSALKHTNDKSNSSNDRSVIFGKYISSGRSIRIDEVNSESGSITVEGTVFCVLEKILNNGSRILNFNITDFTDSLSCKLFIKGEKNTNKITDAIKEGACLRVRGNVQFDTYLNETVLYPNCINEIQKAVREDNSQEKRIELHAHTNMSAMDGITPVAKLIERAKQWGHEAIAITDHGVVQAFPEAYEASKKYGIKVIYGVEGYLVNDEIPIVYNSKDYSFYDEHVVLDIETTGLSSINDKIIEIGAVKIKDGIVTEKYSRLINPEIIIPKKIIKLTGITNEMVFGEKTINEVLPEFLSFIGNKPIVAHNALFDLGFLKNKSEKLGHQIKNTVIDTLELSRNLLTIKKHKLNILCEYFDIKMANHHRALDDAEAAAKLYMELTKILEQKNIHNVSNVNSIVKRMTNKYAESYHVVILVKNQQGLYNLYKLISYSHIDYFYKKPRIPKSLLEEYKDGLIIGSACQSGEIFRSILNNIDEDNLIKKANLYDYFEIMPLENNQFLIERGILNNNELMEINKKIIRLAKQLNKPVVATGDVHFLEPEDEIFRRILMAGQGYTDADNQAPLYFMTTEEMLKKFSYLDEEIAREAVIKNPRKIVDKIESIIPIPEETFPPSIDGADEQIREMTLNKAHSIYGEKLPEIVEKRLNKELDSIINNGYAVMYLIAHKLVSKSLQDGYMVGSRGSVGSSLVATMCDITEVNPLPPHYVCPDCKYSVFFTDNSVGSGTDLPDNTTCPDCGKKLQKDGYDIPFEVFLGLGGNKEPDIDLNFAGEYQNEAHRHTEEIFGEGHVFRAGTIGTLQEKTAYGFVKKYYEEREKRLNQAEITRLISGCTGIKRTTGQHPGGVMIIPSDHNIYEFTPIQRPADDTDSTVITTHFDYRSISGRLLKLDILGHDVPTIIRMLEDITGYNANNIKLDDKTTMSLFTSTDALGIDLLDIDCRTGTLGIPEFGTKFVRQMLMETNPTTFAELIRISGLSHGTDVWLNNAQELIKNNIVSLKDVISTRDDIMLNMTHMGLDPSIAFGIAESVRKGRGISEEYEKAMKDKNVPDWYINSCKIIKYLFPKAHATAYVMMSFRIAYYKIYYPEAFYATYFSVRIEDFDIDLFKNDNIYLKNKWNELNKKGNSATAKEKSLNTVLEVVYEMNCRNIKLLPVDLYKSATDKFIVTEHGILPPLRSVQGLGVSAAIGIEKERNKKPFISIEDLRERTKISKTVIEILKDHGCVEGLPEKNQLSLF